MTIAWLLAGWRVAFLLAQAPIVGAGVLLLIAKLTGATWEEALHPLLARAPWLLIAVLPLIAQQAIIPRPPYLALWLCWPFFALRSAFGLGFWIWLGRSVTRLTRTGAGVALLAHAVIVDVIAVDWIMGVAPGQPETAIGMTLAVAQILAACAVACLFRLGSDKVRGDLSLLLIAACLGFAYLLFIDFVIVWYGNLPQRIGWYQVRMLLPWSLLPPMALIIGVCGTIALIAANEPRRWAGACALLGLFLGLCWLVAPIGGPLALGVALIGGPMLWPIAGRAR